MTTYRLFDGASGRPGVGSSGTQPPASPTDPSGGNFLAGTVFRVTQGGMWLNGYYWWVPPAGDTGAQKFALWNVTSSTPTQTLITGSVVTSGTLTAGAMNYVPLAVPIPLAIGTDYVAATGWTLGAGFPISTFQFGSGDPYSTGVVNGPLQAYADGTTGASPAEMYSLAQGLFGTAGNDPSVHMPASGSNSSIFWVDVLVSDTGPSSYAGSYRAYPNKYDTNDATVADSAVDYIIATEFRLTQACTLDKIWAYSIASTSQLPTSCNIWTILGPNSGTSIAGTDSPGWSGAAGSGWVSCSFTGVVLPAGSYKVSIFNDSGSPDGWSVKDANSNYWGTGVAGSGITWGPLYFPGLSAASDAYEFNGSDAGSTPPYTNGTIEPGQCTFQQTGTNVYPPLYVDGLAQNYWIDVEVTPVTPFYPAVQAVRARLTRQPQGIGAPRGRVGSDPGGPVPPPVPPPVYPLQGPVRGRFPQRPFLRGRVTSDAGGPLANPAQGPVFRQAVRPARAVIPQVFSKGRASSNAGIPAPFAGPPFRQAAGPARIRPVLPPRGRVTSSPGAPVSDPRTGPPVCPLPGPVRARIPQVFSKGRVRANPGALATAPVPAPVYPLHGPVMARRPLPSRGRVFTGNPGGPARNPHPGPVFFPAVRPIRAVIPQNAPRGRTTSNPGGPRVPVPRPGLAFTFGSPYWQWETEEPYFQWEAGTAGFQWATEEPYLS